MRWEMLVIVGQLSAGGALVMIGLRWALQHWVATRDKGHAERLSKARGRPVGHSMRPVVNGLVAVAIGAVLLLTIDITAGMLGPETPPW